MRSAVAAGFVDTMSQMEHKAIELARQIAVVVVHLEEAGIPGELKSVGTVEVEANFGIVAHAVAVESDAGIEGSAEIAGNFAMIWGSAVTDNDGHVVHVEPLACIGRVEVDFEPEAQH